MIFTTHTVEQSQDIFFLAEFYYGDASNWWIIYHANQEALGDDPESPSPGTALVIPALETSRETVEMPSYVPATAFNNAYDPLIQYARDYYGDGAMAFDVRENNDLADDETVLAGTELRMPPRGKPSNLNKAKHWRTKFYRRWVTPQAGI